MISYDEFIKTYEGHGVDVIKQDEQAFRKYSEAIIEWLKDLNLQIPRDDKYLDVEIIYAYPMKANALKGAPSHLPDGQKIKNLDEKLVDLRENRTNIPIISFYLSDFSFDWPRELPTHMRYSKQKMYESGNQMKATRYQKDRPFELTYSFSLWTKYKADMNYLWQQFLSEFGPNKYFRVDNQDIPMKLNSITDVSDLESKDGAEQLVRWDIRCAMEGWLKVDKVEVDTVKTQVVVMGEMVIKEGQIGLDPWIKKSVEYDAETEEVLNEETVDYD